MKSRSSFAIIVFGAVTVFPSIASYAFSGQQYADQAKVTISEARKVAVRMFPGKVISEELEHEQGGSGLRYSFDIKQNGVTHEVGVDAITGKVLENTVEGPGAD